MTARERGTSVADMVGFDHFYASCRLEIFRALVFVLRDRELAADATDEAFARAFERWDDVTAYSNPRGWVYRVGLNWGRSRMRKTRREVLGYFTEGSYESAVAEPELLKAVASLPFKYRAVIVCRFFLDWSIEETSEALGIPLGTVKTRQFRAVDRLRGSLGDES